ncbi:MAG TPA: SpoIIE family protein phosphatase [Solirubrobacterales bacterium]
MSQAISVAHARAIIESSEDAILSKDREGVITFWNQGAERLYGYTPDEAIGEHISILIPPHRANEEQDILSTILAGGRVEHYETERRRKDGSLVVVSLTVSPIRGEDDEVTGASVIARDITESRRIGDRAHRLQRLTQALSREISTVRVAGLLVEEAVPAAGADAALVGLVDEGEENLALVALHGYSEVRLEDWSAFPVAADLPMSEVVRTGFPAWSSSSRDAKDRWPDLAETRFRFESLACVPLKNDVRAFGAVVFSFREQREFSAEERGFMLAMAQQAANALERTKLHELERRARDQLAFIARASEVLGSSLDPDETLQALATVAVPQVADWCVVHLVEEDGLRAVALAHADPEMVQRAGELQERFPTAPDALRGLTAVIASGEPEIYPEITDEMIAEAARDEEHLAILRELGFHSVMIVPLATGGTTFGAITFVSAESERRYGEEDLTFALELARHAALAIDNSRSYLREHQAAVTLQRALLPERLPETPGIELAARYLPAGPGVEAGGDWYDAIDLGDGLFDVIIGDVSGRGIPAASIMGRLRTAVHAYALDRLPPAKTAARVDRLLSGLEGDEMATMLLLRFDASNHRAEFVRAGHPPALVREPGGEVVELDGGGSPPLGLMLEEPRPSASRELAPGSTVLLYTDGLIERRGEVIDAGIERLKRAFARASHDLQPCLDEIIEATAPQAADDVAALLMRVA